MVKSFISSNPIVAPASFVGTNVIPASELGSSELSGPRIESGVTAPDHAVANAFVSASEKAGVQTLIQVGKALKNPFDLSDLVGRYQVRAANVDHQFAYVNGADMTGHKKAAKLSMDPTSPTAGTPATVDHDLLKFLAKSEQSPAAEAALLKSAINGEDEGLLWLKMVELAVTGKSPKYAPLLETPLVKHLIGMTTEPIYLPSNNVARPLWGGKKIGNLLAEIGYGELKGNIIGEAWVASGHPTLPSKVKVEYEGETIHVPLNIFGAVTGKHFYGNQNVDRFGANMPFLVKLLDAGMPLSVQVHPKSDYPGLKSGQHSKTEAWAILEAEKGAGIYLGLKDGVTKAEFEATLRSGGDVSVHLNFVPVKPGDVFFIPAGTMHAIGAGVTLVEPQETSDTTYRVYDWGRTGVDGKPRQLHIEDTLAATDWDGLKGSALVESLRRPPRFISGGLGHPAETDPRRAVYQNIVSQKEFSFNKITFEYGDEFDPNVNRGVEHLLITEGEVEILYSDGYSINYKKGQSILIPANVHYMLRATSDRAVVFQTMAGSEKQVAKTSFRDPNAKVVDLLTFMSDHGVKFGTSGVRGDADKITDEVAYTMTLGYIQYLESIGQLPANGGGEIVIAGDLRPSTDRIMNAVSRAITDSGHAIFNGGHIPTPAVSWYGFQNGLPSIMVTGSHIPFHMNGIKFNMAARETYKTDESAIMAQRVPHRSELFNADGSFKEKNDVLGVTQSEVEEFYLDRIREYFPEGFLKGKRIGVFSHSAVGRDILINLLREFGAEVTELERSNTFVPFDTEAISQEMRAKATAWSSHYGFDAIVSMDGDSDRPAIADENGNWLEGDILGALAARSLGADVFVTPNSSNRGIGKVGWFKEVVTTAIGSPYVAAAMARASRDGASVIGAEGNAGTMLQTDIHKNGRTLEKLPTRAAVEAIFAVLDLSVREGREISSLSGEIPWFTSRGRIKEFPKHIAQALISKFSTGDDEVDTRNFLEIFRGAIGEGVGVAEIDRKDPNGVCFILTNGRILYLRASGNADEFRIYAQAETKEWSDDIFNKAYDIVEQWAFDHHSLAIRGQE